MNWVLQRWLITLASLVVGGAVGHGLGGLLGTAEVGALLGMSAAAAAVVLQNMLHAARLLQWLRGTQESAAPPAAGFWGELGQRIERSLRTREQALADEHRRLAEFLSAIEASPNGVLLLDAKDQILWCSAVGADHLGLHAQRDLLQPITNLVRAPVFVAYVQERAWSEQITMPAPGVGGTLQVVMRGYGDGQKLVITQDVTERMRAEAMRRDFVANVSHEIRTPLTVLAGFVETMASLPLGESDRKRVLALMQQQTDRMQVLVSDLLQLARLEGSPRPPTDRWAALAPLLQRAAADGRTLSAGRHALTLADMPEIEVAVLDAELFSAVSNLVTNAVRYTPDGGRIDIRWQTRADGSGEIEVADSGVGISRDHLPRLSERFYRVDGSRSRDTGGTGLGLSIVKHVMQRHGGSLEIDSAPGKGSRFRLLLPAGRVRDGAAQPQLA